MINGKLSREEEKEVVIKRRPDLTPEVCSDLIDKDWEKGIAGKEAQIPRRFRKALLSDLGNKKTEIVSIIKKIMNTDDDTDKVGVIFSGEVGTGKTHAAYAVLRSLIHFNPNSVSSMYDYQGMMLDLKRESFEGRDIEQGYIWDSLVDWSESDDNLLFIDDVSSKKMTDFELERMLMCVNKRVNDFYPTLLTTNIKESEFEEVFGERLASRLSGSFYIIGFDGKDRRQIKK